MKHRAETRTSLASKSHSAIFEQAQRAARLHADFRKQALEAKQQGHDARVHNDFKIQGRTEFSILIEKLFETVKNKCKLYKSPLLLCLAIAEKSASEIMLCQ
mmetsp:Transcript_38220/g.66462  ORF Transcript_38220/g.66462 Transcript_38220/m.66462 type:complete len:102 (-) Transcript_38220:64-369(-)